MEVFFFYSNDCLTIPSLSVLFCEFILFIAIIHICLFKTFCTPMCTAHLWWNYKSNMHRFKVAHNEGLRRLLNLSRGSSASQMFECVGVDTRPAVHWTVQLNVYDISVSKQRHFRPCKSCHKYG